MGLIEDFDDEFDPKWRDNEGEKLPWEQEEGGKEELWRFRADMRFHDDLIRRMNKGDDYWDEDEED